jgi:hypothetical protein
MQTKNIYIQPPPAFFNKARKCTPTTLISVHRLQLEVYTDYTYKCTPTALRGVNDDQLLKSFFCVYSDLFAERGRGC